MKRHILVLASGLFLVMGSMTAVAGDLETVATPVVTTKSATNGNAGLGDAVADNKSIDVSCDSGYVLVSCGVQLSGSTGGGAVTAASLTQIADNVSIVENRPLGAATGCRARAIEPNNGLTNAYGWKITATAICLKVDAETHWVN